MAREDFHFANLKELRDWLNGFAESDPNLETALPHDRDTIDLTLIYSALSDGSEVVGVDFNNPGRPLPHHAPGVAIDNITEACPRCGETIPTDTEMDGCRDPDCPTIGRG